MNRAAFANRGIPLDCALSTRRVFTRHGLYRSLIGGNMLCCLQVVKNKFDSSRHTDPIENLEQIISHDEMLALGWSARRVALATYATTMGLAIIAWFGAQSSFREFLLAWSLSLAGLLVIASRLGCLRAEPPVIRSHAGISVAVGKSASKTS